jgi:hypothetical protein
MPSQLHDVIDHHLIAHHAPPLLILLSQIIPRVFSHYWTSNGTCRQPNLEATNQYSGAYDYMTAGSEPVLSSDTRFRSRYVLLQARVGASGTLGAAVVTQLKGRHSLLSGNLAVR